MLNKIMTKEVNDIKVSVMQFEDYIFLNEASYEVAVVDPDDVKVINRYFTEEEALKVAEGLIAQALIETIEADIIPPTMTAEEFIKVIEAYDLEPETLHHYQQLLSRSISGGFAKNVAEFMLNYYGVGYDEDIHKVHMEEYLDLTMYKHNIYNTEFNKFFSYWMPKEII